MDCKFDVWYWNIPHFRPMEKIISLRPFLCLVVKSIHSLSWSSLFWYFLEDLVFSFYHLFSNNTDHSLLTDIYKLAERYLIRWLAWGNIIINSHRDIDNHRKFSCIVTYSAPSSRYQPLFPWLYLPYLKQPLLFITFSYSCYCCWMFPWGLNPSILLCFLWQLEFSDMTLYWP